MQDYDHPSEDGNAPPRDAPKRAKIYLVCGGREYDERDRIFSALDKLHRRDENITILHGACPTGADAIAHEWAMLNECPAIAVPAEWSKYGAPAGPIRNKRLLCYLPDGVVAFAGGAGTGDMIRQAEAAGVKVWRP